MSRALRSETRFYAAVGKRLRDALNSLNEMYQRERNSTDAARAECERYRAALAHIAAQNVIHASEYARAALDGENNANR